MPLAATVPLRRAALMIIAAQRRSPTVTLPPIATAAQDYVRPMKANMCSWSRCSMLIEVTLCRRATPPGGPDGPRLERDGGTESRPADGSHDATVTRPTIPRRA